MGDKKKIIGINILLVIAVIISPIASTAEILNAENISIEPTVSSDNDFLKNYYNGRTKGDLMWNNNMSYEGLFASQWDEVLVFDAIIADDFLFEEETLVDDLHWIGGYWNTNYLEGNFNWTITFYNDRGDGEAPGETIAGPFLFLADDLDKVLVEDTDGNIYYLYSVVFEEYLHFEAGVKYWISAQGIGIFPPQSGFAYHQDPIKLKPCVFKSEYFSQPDWNSSEDFFEYAVDTCFQLTREEDNTDPTVEITKPEKAFYIGNRKIFNRIFGISLIIGKIKVEAIATDDKGIAKVEFYAGLAGDELIGEDTTAPYNITWTRDRLRLIHLHKLTVIAYDYLGNTGSDSIIVRKFL